VLNVFTGMGFELVGTPLFDEMAAGEAIHHLVVDDLAGLGRKTASSCSLRAMDIP